MRRRLRRPPCTLATAALVAAVATGCAGLDNRVDGTLVEVQDTGEPGTAAVLVELDEGDLIGSTYVRVTFDLEVLRCIEGGDATADDPRADIDVRAQRFESDEINPIDPPAVRGTDVAIRCSDSPGEAGPSGA